MSEKPKTKHKPDDPAQYKRFIEAARKAEADETEEGADRAFKGVVSGGTQSRSRQSNKSGRAK
jgi:hypothetical protein